MEHRMSYWFVFNVITTDVLILSWWCLCKCSCCYCCPTCCFCEQRKSKVDVSHLTYHVRSSLSVWNLKALLCCCCCCTFRAAGTLQPPPHVAWKIKQHCSVADSIWQLIWHGNIIIVVWRILYSWFPVMIHAQCVFLLELPSVNFGHFELKNNYNSPQYFCLSSHFVRSNLWLYIYNNSISTERLWLANVFRVQLRLFVSLLIRK